ncbi:MAG: hypothetical protein IMZ40_01165 [Bacilli bacterium]|nr:hypothetical protein [Bacilli bacterium]
MTSKISKTFERKVKMQEKIEKMEKEIKELELKAQQEIGKFVLSEWEISEELDSEILFDIIRGYKEDVRRKLNSTEYDEKKGKLEEKEIQLIL